MKNEQIKQLSEHEPTLIGLDECKVSAVCVPLIPTEDEQFDILFEVRSSKIDSQPGDICFPGGMLEGEEIPQETALRELKEELLVTDDQVKLIGALDYIKTPTLVIYPYSVVLEHYEGSYSEDEVAETFRVPLSFFLEHEPEVYVTGARVILPDDFPYDRIYGGRSYRWRDRKDTVLFYEYEGHHIWGLTAKIMHAFVNIITK